jgi:hypothetical protein
MPWRVKKTPLFCLSGLTIRLCASDDEVQYDFLRLWKSTPGTTYRDSTKHKPTSTPDAPCRVAGIVAIVIRFRHRGKRSSQATARLEVSALP